MLVLLLSHSMSLGSAHSEGHRQGGKPKQEPAGVQLSSGKQERTSVALGCGAGLPACGAWSVSEGGTSALTGSAGAPVRVTGSRQCGNRPVFYAALVRSRELRRGDPRVECDPGWLRVGASAAAVTGDAIFPAVWLGVLPGCPEEVRCLGSDGDELLVRASGRTRGNPGVPSGFPVCAVASAWQPVSWGKPWKVSGR